MNKQKVGFQLIFVGGCLYLGAIAIAYLLTLLVVGKLWRSHVAFALAALIATAGWVSVAVGLVFLGFCSKALRIKVLALCGCGALAIRMVIGVIELCRGRVMVIDDGALQLPGVYWEAMVPEISYLANFISFLGHRRFLEWVKVVKGLMEIVQIVFVLVVVREVTKGTKTCSIGDYALGALITLLGGVGILMVFNRMVDMWFRERSLTESMFRTEIALTSSLNSIAFLCFLGWYLVIILKGQKAIAQ